jgi:two-component system sensor histidine kinase KdpD
LADHKVELDIPSDLPMVNVDPVLFEQVLFNLLDNAAKYSSPSTTVRIEGAHCPGEDHVQIQILDEGRGIDESDLDKIFEKFHRSSKGDSVRAGTGLGLSVCRGFVEAMGGTITAGNRTDRSGAVFTLNVPASRPAGVVA